ncbi:MAG: preprotein translocase subunit SecG [Burkholderiaceae bacterium]
MAILATLAVVIQVLSAIGVIVLVLLQHGKGADMGAAFGSGSSGSPFGASGSANFLSRLTAGLATVFFVCTLALAFFANSRTVERAPASVMDAAPTSAPASPSTGSSVPGPASPAVPAAAPGNDATQKSGGASDIPK